LQPLEGALEFLRELRRTTQVVILSDTFEEFAQPLLKQLEWPTLLCHKLDVMNDRVVNYQLRIPNQKQRAVAAFRDMNYHVVAAGDSFNDTAMLAAANVGIFFRAPVSIQQQFPQFRAVEEYAELLRLIRTAL
jgi:phosphoserine / homoserine phosphotransferase